MNGKVEETWEVYFINTTFAYRNLFFNKRSIVLRPGYNEA